MVILIVVVVVRVGSARAFFGSVTAGIVPERVRVVELSEVLLNHTNPNQTVGSAVASRSRLLEVLELVDRRGHGEGVGAAAFGAQALRARRGVGTDHGMAAVGAVLVVDRLPTGPASLAVGPQACLLVHDEVARLHFRLFHDLLLPRRPTDVARRAA